ncbi:MAG: CBS domain-containing protein [Nitrospirota bacterium]|jgi:CBS domain-containing membrane protein
MRNRRNSLISDIMTTRVHSVQEHAMLSSACCIMAENHLRHVPVLSGKKLVGLISHRDLCRAMPSSLLGADDAKEKGFIDALARVEDVMIQNPKTLKPTDTMKSALEVLIETKYGCLPIVDDDHELVGVVTSHDLLMFLNAMWAVLKEDVTA